MYIYYKEKRDERERKGKRRVFHFWGVVLRCVFYGLEDFGQVRVLVLRHFGPFVFTHSLSFGFRRMILKAVRVRQN